jgi:hypothetical protein
LIAGKTSVVPSSPSSIDRNVKACEQRTPFGRIVWTVFSWFFVFFFLNSISFLKITREWLTLNGQGLAGRCITRFGMAEVEHRRGFAERLN